MKCLLLLAALSSAAASAQAQPSGALVWWADVSAGYDAPPMAFSGGAHVSVGRRVAVRLGFDASTEVTLGAPATSVRAASLSVGARAQRGRLRFAAHLGPSVVWGLDRYDVDRQRTGRRGPGREPYVTAGAAYSGSVFIAANPGFGLGLNVSGNLNPEVSTVGVRLAVQTKLSRAR